jgi:hypothetical protein
MFLSSENHLSGKPQYVPVIKWDNLMIFAELLHWHIMVVPM